MPRYLWCCARESGRLGSYIEVGINWKGVGMPTCTNVLPRDEGCHPPDIVVTAKTGVVKKSVSIFIVGQAAKDKCS